MTVVRPDPPITLLETFGLAPLPLRAREAWLAVRGDATTPPTRFGLSSLGIFHPALSVRTWLGGRRADRRVPISCLVNRTPTPLELGWSVRKTQVRDFRGGTLTYDSHNGTDFAVPVGTVVVAAAPSRVLRVSSELNRGGLKIFVERDGCALLPQLLPDPFPREAPPLRICRAKRAQTLPGARQPCVGDRVGSAGTSRMRRWCGDCSWGARG